jgi:hypothetical protein
LRLFVRPTPLAAWGGRFSQPTEVNVAPAVDLKAVPVEQNGRAININLDRCGTNPKHRAFIVLVGLGANLPEDAVLLAQAGHAR